MELLLSYWPWLIAAAAFVLDLLVSVHIVFYKRDSRSATAWIAIVWFSPFLGSLFYYLLGINRIERRARRLRGKGGFENAGPRAVECLDTPEERIRAGAEQLDRAGSFGAAAFFAGGSLGGEVMGEDFRRLVPFLVYLIGFRDASQRRRHAPHRSLGSLAF